MWLVCPFGCRAMEEEDQSAVLVAEGAIKSIKITLSTSEEIVSSSSWWFYSRFCRGACWTQKTVNVISQVRESCLCFINIWLKLVFLIGLRGYFGQLQKVLWICKINAMRTPCGLYVILPPFLNICLSRDFNKWLHTDVYRHILKYRFIHFAPYEVTCWNL